MSRAIDVEKAIEIIETKQKELCPVGRYGRNYVYGSDREKYDTLDEIIDVLENLPTLTPPNEPLTIEQLREMKDKPAYLNVFDPLLESGWHIIKAVTEDKIIFRGWQTVYVPTDGMGIDYNLYRRPPEGEEDTNA